MPVELCEQRSEALELGESEWIEARRFTREEKNFGCCDEKVNVARRAISRDTTDSDTTRDLKHRSSPPKSKRKDTSYIPPLALPLSLFSILTAHSYCTSTAQVPIKKPQTREDLRILYFASEIE